MPAYSADVGNCTSLAGKSADLKALQYKRLEIYDKEDMYGCFILSVKTTYVYDILINYFDYHKHP